MQDRLAEIFQLQRSFDEDLARRRGLDYDLETWVQKEALAMLSELAEVIDLVNFKWWKNRQPLDLPALQEELVDLLHFLVSTCIKVGMGPEELYQSYLGKNQKNRQRQLGTSGEDGYAWPAAGPEKE